MLLRTGSSLSCGKIACILPECVRRLAILLDAEISAICPARSCIFLCQEAVSCSCCSALLDTSQTILCFSVVNRRFDSFMYQG